MLRRTLISVVLATLVLCAGVAASASAAIYWGAFDGSFDHAVATVGAANLDGGSPIFDYLDALEAPGSEGAACGVAVGGGYLYWAGEKGIGRVNLDGPALPETVVPNLQRPCGITVDEAHVYWASAYYGSIGRANLDGTEANPYLLAGLQRPCDVAVGAGYVYWSQSGAIGRARIDGSQAQPNFLPKGAGGCALGVGGPHLYWEYGESIARAGIDGTDLDLSFISGVGAVEGIATDPDHIYWVDHPPRAHASIARANIDGSEANRSWIPSDPSDLVVSDQSNLLGVAVDSRPAPPPLLRPARPIKFGKATHDTRAGSVSLEVWVPDWGALAVTAPGLSTRVVADGTPNPKRGGALRWRVELRALKTRAGKRVRTRLKNKGVAAVTVRATFSLARTSPVSAVRRVKLRKKLPPDPR